MNEYAITSHAVNPMALVTRSGVIRGDTAAIKGKVTLRDGRKAMIFDSDGIRHVALPSDLRAAEVYGPSGGHELAETSDEELITQCIDRGLI